MARKLLQALAKFMNFMAKYDVATAEMEKLLKYCEKLERKELLEIFVNIGRF